MRYMISLKRANLGGLSWAITWFVTRRREVGGWVRLGLGVLALIVSLGALAVAVGLGSVVMGIVLAAVGGLAWGNAVRQITSRADL
jgi:hypothetical protein